MTTVKQAPVTGDLRVISGRKTPSFKVFGESEIYRESYGSCSEDIESYSPKSVFWRTRRWPAAVKNVNAFVFGRRVRNQIERIRAEDSHLGEDIGECLIVKICGGGHDDDVSRPASPLSGKVANTAP